MSYDLVYGKLSYNESTSSYTYSNTNAVGYNLYNKIQLSFDTSLLPAEDFTLYWNAAEDAVTVDTATGTVSGKAPDYASGYYINVTYTVDGVALETSSVFVTLR